VDVAALELVGKTCEEATGIAQQAGLVASCTPGNPAPSPDQVGLVYSVSPTGNAPEGSQLTLTVYADQTPIGAPTVTAGSTVQINWDGFTCPSGTGSVVSYNFTAVNGIFTSTGQSTAAAGPNQRPIPLEVGTNTGQALIVSYTVTCSGSGDGTTRDSETSPQAQANVQSSSPSPSPSATTNPLLGGN
jgi:serine/threonine-protein kinase